MAIHEHSMDEYTVNVWAQLRQEQLAQALKIHPARARVEWYLSNVPGKFKVKDVAQLLNVTPYQVKYQIQRLGLLHIGQGWYLTGVK